MQQLEGLLADCDDRLQQAHEQAAVLAAERDAAARNLLRAEAELNDVSDYSTKMFRQVGVYAISASAEPLLLDSRDTGACWSKHSALCMPVPVVLSHPDTACRVLPQVRFISHVLDKNSALLGKLPEFASLTRDLRAFVAANARTWEPRDSSQAAGGPGPGAAQPSASNADTTASGMRDVAGKA